MLNLVAIEERLNAGVYSKVFAKSLKLDEVINTRLSRISEPETSLYDDICEYISLKLPEFLRNSQDGKIKIYNEKFYQYALIDNMTWSSIKNNNTANLTKKTLLKLIIALKLNYDEAERMLCKFGFIFSANDVQEQIILAMIDLREKYSQDYDVDEVKEILFQYQEMYIKEGRSFTCIYKPQYSIMLLRLVVPL